MREHRAGNLVVAEALYREALRWEPHDADALHMLGVIGYQTQRLWEAFLQIHRALELTNWRVASMRYNFGLVVAMLSSERMSSPELPAELGDSKAVLLAKAKNELLHASRRQFGYRLEERVAPLVIASSLAPRVSIVVCASGPPLRTYSCVKSIVAHTPPGEYEVILVDDGSAEPVSGFLGDIQGWRVVCNESELGFVQSCNRAAQAARGNLVVLLNSDTLVTPGWLEALVAPLADAGVGLVGAKHIDPDGRLQEAGGIVLCEGSVRSFGRNDDSGRPQYNYFRGVDYCSAACIAIRRSDFLSLDGFHARFAPGRYADADLAMRVRSLGKDVVYQPGSTVVHFDEATCGADPDSARNEWQFPDRSIFRDRWRAELALHGTAESNPELEIDRRSRARVLVIDGRMPAPDRDSGSMRAIGVMRILRDLGCKVTFTALNMEFATPYGDQLQRDGIEVLHQPYFWTIGEVLAERGAEVDMIIVSHHDVASAVYTSARRYAPRALFVFDTVDLHYLREQRESIVRNDGEAVRRAAITRQRELDVVRVADVTVAVSAVEKAVLEREVPERTIAIVSNIHAVNASTIPFESRHNLFFVGGYGHPPNVDAVKWFSTSVWPIVREKLPDVTVFLIGSEMPGAVAALAGDGIEPVGHVRDLAPYLEHCRIAIAPLRYGAGVKGKVTLAQSWGVPVVATTIAAEGMQLEHGRDVLIADAPLDFANAIFRMYTDQALWTAISEGGRANVARCFSSDVAAEALDGLVRMALGKRRSDRIPKVF